jgi:sec-independent protein translocase protein TatB
MLGISWYEYLLIAVVALIVIGPKELPAVLRALGQWTAKIQRMAAEFRGQFQEAMREAEMADLKKEVDNLGDQARGFTSQFNDPVNFQDFKDSMKWEPKTDEADKTSEAGNTAEISKQDDAVKPPEDSPAPATPEPVTPVSHGGAAGPAAAEGQPASVQTAAAPESATPASPGTAPKAEEGVHS